MSETQASEPAAANAAQMSSGASCCCVGERASLTSSPDALRNRGGEVRSFLAPPVYSRRPGCLLRVALGCFALGAALLVLAFCWGCRSDYQRVPPPIAPQDGFGKPNPDLERLPGLDHEEPTYQPAAGGGELRQVYPGARDRRDYSAENRQWLAVRGRWFLLLGAALGAIGFGLCLATQNPLLDFFGNIGGYIGLAGCGAGLAFMQLAQWWVWVSIGCLVLLAATVGYRLWRHRRQRRAGGARA